MTILLVIVAIVLLTIAVIIVPQPRIRLSGVRYQTTACDPTTTSFVATAVVTLTNDGAGNGAIVVSFYVDGRLRATTDFFIPAHSTLQRAMDAVIEDCANHIYSVYASIPSEGFLPAPPHSNSK